MFKLTEKTCKLTNINLRTEFHGDQHKPAADISFNLTMQNDVLDMFDKELRPMLFEEKPVHEKDLADQATDEAYLTQIRFPYLQKKLKWGYKGAGYRLSIPLGVTGDQDVYLHNCDIDKFEFEPKEGGSVVVFFQIHCHPTKDEIGRLYEKLSEEVELSLIPPSAEDRAQMELDAMRDEDQDED